MNIRARKTTIRKPLSSAPAMKASIARAEPKQRQTMIAEAAYYRAEARGFVPGHEEEDWHVAEREIESILARGGAASA